MDTERCREFVTLAQTCNYLQAADQLFISQSSLSKHIKALERELGVDLFNRTTRRVQLTEHGRVFLPFARKLAAMAHDAEVALADASDNERRIIDIGSIPVMVPYGITELLTRFERDHPNVHLRITEGEADQLKDLLRNRILDLAFIREWDGDVGQRDVDDEFSSTEYAQDRLAAVLPASHPLAARPTIKLSELANDEFLLLPQGTVMNALITDACAADGFVPEVRYRGTRAENIIDLVARGMGVSLLMRTPAAYLARAAVSIVDLENPIMTKVKLYHLRDRELTPDVREFLEYLPIGMRNR
jgi:DNA-binding transcriptional LysR family regulator